jgi:peptidoglycan/LPS O-acetylase OafA/YrhL
MPQSTQRPLGGAAASYRPALDGLRAVAVILVMANHANLPGFAPWMGQAGVSIFFVISGYLITGLLLHRHDGLAAFWQRRALRLVPALAVLLLIVTPIALSRGDEKALFHAVAGALYIGNWVRVSGDHLGALGNLWSLAVEEQFYLVWPLVLLFLRPRVRWLLLVVVAVTVFRFTQAPTAAIYGTFGRIDALLLGAVLAISGLRLPRWAAPAGLALIVGFYLLRPDQPAVATLGLAVASVAGVLLVGGLADRPALGLERRAPRTVGRISYGLYLWNTPMIILFGPVGGSILTVVAAVASYHVVERPFLRLKDRLAPRREVQGGMTTAAPVPVHIRFDS